MAKKQTDSLIEVLDFPLVEDQSQNIIKVIGVGGGGCNAVRNMYDEGIEGVTYAVCNTDSASLSKSRVPVKIQLGEGLGAGGDPSIGRTEAEANLNDLERLLDDGTKMAFITAGMGGGTGTGAAPVVARVAQQKGILTVGVVTIPFYFEQKRKIIKALKGVDELRKNVDAMLIINNERLCDIYGDSNETIKEAFQRADNILKDAVKGISELITVSTEGGINLDFRDVEATMRNGGGAIIAMGRASGENRVERAIIDALDSPLLYGNDIGKAKRILFNIYSSDDYPFRVREMLEIDDFFAQLDPNIDVIWGTSVDEALGEDAKVTILATGMEDELRSEARRSYQYENNEEYYEELIPKLYKPIERKKLVWYREEESPVQPVASEGALSEPVTTPSPLADESATEAVQSEGSVQEPVTAQPESSEPEPTTHQEEKPAGSPVQRDVPILEKWKNWLMGKLNEVMSDSDE